MSAQAFDVIVVGASLGGCTAATLLAREGLRVALVERHREAEGHKQLCTHFIQASATPVLRRLGLDRLIEAAGGVRNSLEIHTPHGWIGDHLGADAAGRPQHGYNIRRARLDPMLRELAAATPGLTSMSGWSARALVEHDGRIAGVELSAGEGKQSCTLHAALVVAADGRNSALASLAGVKPKSAPTRRFGIAVQMRDVDLRRGQTSQMWLTGPAAAYVFPNDAGITVLAWMGLKEDLDACREQPLEALKLHLRRLPDAPQLQQAVVVGEPMTVKDYPNLWRAPVVRGMALVGDAALSVDYLWGVGCGWAFESGAWLADAVAPALKQRSRLDAALAAYRRRCDRALNGHRFLINDFAGRRDFNTIERLMFSAAAKDAGMARHVNRFGARIDGPRRFLAPSALLRAMWVNLRRPAAGPQGTRSAGTALQSQRLAGSH